MPDRRFYLHGGRSNFRLTGWDRDQRAERRRDVRRGLEHGDGRVLNVYPDAGTDHDQRFMYLHPGSQLQAAAR